MKKKILFIGPYSAVGGVSIHIKRLSGLLNKNFVCSYIDESPITKKEREIYNLRSGNVFMYLKLIYRTDYVHIHSGLWWLRLVHVIVSNILRKKVFMTIHSLGKSRQGIPLMATKIASTLTYKTIMVSQEIFNLLNIKNAEIKPAFIPPNVEEESELPEEVLHILEKNNSKKIIVGNAFKLVLYNKKDLYGLDLLIEIAKKIKQNNLQYKIIFVVASVSEDDLLIKNYYEIVNQYALHSIISIIPYKISFIRLILSSDLVVRPTCSDGDALTIREALFLGKQVIASDVVIRPTQTILFKNRDVEDLFSKIKVTLSDINFNSQNSKGMNKSLKKYQEEFISLYH